MAAVPKRICYIHIGPHKTGTSSIQTFLKENRAELLKYGYFVPASETFVGAHHPLVRQLCGEPLPERKERAALRSLRQLRETPAEAVIISSEALATLLRDGDTAKAFFSRIGELNLQPKLVIFPRNQPQWLNSRYTQEAKSCFVSSPFASYVQSAVVRLNLRYSPYLEVADTYGVEVIARPFTAETIATGVVPTFLEAVGMDASRFQKTDVRSNELVGPFTVAAGRGIARALTGAGKQLKWRQATRCKSHLAAYLQRTALTDSGYCGLTTALTRQVEQQCQADNDAFAQRAWGAPWKERFVSDVDQEFTPNDFDVAEPDDATRQLLAQTIDELMPIVEDIMRDPALAVDEPWNDLQQRAGPTGDSAGQETSSESARTI